MPREISRLDIRKMGALFDESADFESFCGLIRASLVHSGAALLGPLTAKIVPQKLSSAAEPRNGKPGRQL